MGLRIGIDGRVFLGNKTGLCRYVTELCKALDKALPDSVFIVYSKNLIDLPIDGYKWILRTETSWLKQRMKNLFWQKFISGFLCRKDRIDVYWGAASSLPFFLGKISTVLTVYDMSYKIVPETMYKYNLWAFRLFFKGDALKATKITTISEGTSKRLYNILGSNSDATIYPSANNSFSPQEESVIRKCLKKYDLPSPYFLAVATWEPRKNLHLLIETFLRMKQRGELVDYYLILVGGRGWKDDKINSIAGTSNKNNGVIPLNYVDDKDLAALYSGATALVFPSIYEGFGLPVIEAIKCGIPVITSDIPELREAGGSRCIYIQPTCNGIREGILRCLTEKIDTSLDDIRNPTWEESAKKMAQVLVDAGKVNPNVA